MASKIFLDNETEYGISNADTLVYGSNNTESITIAATEADGTTAVTGLGVDANVEQVNFAGAMADYHYLQAGNTLAVYKTDGVTLVAIVITDGSSLVSFAGAAAVDVVVSGGTMTLAGSLVDATTPTTLAPTESGLAADLATASSGWSGNENVSITDVHTLANLKTINNATTGAITLSDTTVALDGTAADVKAALDGTITAYTGTSTLSGTTSASDADTIANATTGVVTATITTGAVTATLGAIGNVDANDVITFETNDTTAVDASDLVDLKALVDTYTEETTINAITEAYDTADGAATEVVAALAIATGTSETVEITGGAISASDANTIANATTGAVTATITSAGVTATLGAIGNVDANDVITFETNDTTAVDASDLVDLKALVDTYTEGTEITALTEASTDIGASAVEVTDALTIVQNAATVAVTGADISAANLDLIAAHAKAGNITATITSAGVTATLSAISNVDTADVITFETNDTTVDASDLVDLAALVDSGTYTSISGAITESSETASFTDEIANAYDIATNATSVDFTNDSATLTYTQFIDITDTDGLALTADDNITVTGGVDDGTKLIATAVTNVDTTEVDDGVTATLTVAQMNALVGNVIADADGSGSDATTAVSLANSDTVIRTTDLVDVFTPSLTDGQSASITGLGVDDTIVTGITFTENTSQTIVDEETTGLVYWNWDDASNTLTYELTDGTGSDDNTEASIVLTGVATVNESGGTFTIASLDA